MDAMQDLLTIQLEHQESQTRSLAMLYGTTPHLFMLNSSPTSEVETDDSRSSTPESISSVQPLSRDWGHSVQFMHILSGTVSATASMGSKPSCQ